MKYLSFFIVISAATFYIDIFKWGPRWALLVSAIGIYFSINVGKKTNWICGVATGYTILNGLYIAVWRLNQYTYWTPEKQKGLHDGVYYALIAFVFLVYWISNTSKKERKWIEYGFVWLCLLDTIIVIYQLQLPPRQRSGLMQYIGMNGSFIAMTLPLVWQCFIRLNVKQWIWIMGTIGPIVAVIISNSSVPFGVLAAVLVTFLCCKARGYYSKRQLLIILPSIVLIIAVVLGSIGSHLYSDFFSSAGRFNIYKLNYEWMMSWKHNYWHPWFGTGNGTYDILGSAILGARMAFAHSDMLQVFFEMGKWGVIIYGVLFSYAAWIFWRQNKIYHLCSLNGWLACALFNFPGHAPITAILGVYLIREAYGRTCQT